MQRKHSHCIVMHHWPTMMPLHCLESGHIMILRCRGITTLSVSQSLSVSPVKRLIFLSSTPQSEWWPYTYRFNIQPIIWPNLLMSNSRKIHNQLHNQLQQLPSYNQITTDWFSSCVSNLHRRHVESVISPITTHKITWYLSPLLSAELLPSIYSLDLVFFPI